MRNRDKIIIYVITMTFFLNGFVLVQATNEQDLNMSFDAIKKDAKLDSSINQLLFPSQSLLSISNEFEYVGEKIRVEILLSAETDLGSLIEDRNDIEIECHYKKIVQCLVPPSNIQSLTDLTYINYIRKPIKPFPLVVSEGVNKIQANLVHQKGFYGAGVKVAVIDLGFQGYYSNPDIPASQVVEAISFVPGEGVENGEPHGAACAEIVIDVAPQANLYLYTFSTISEFSQAVDQAIYQDVDIISYSVGWVGIDNYDGTSEVDQIAAYARSNGILFIASAGNQAQRHYEGTWSDPDGDDIHNFNSNTEVLSLGYMSAGQIVHLVLSWNDWPNSDQNYDLWLLQYYDGEYYVVTGSVGEQSGSQPPLEIIFGYLTFSDYLYVGITRYSATQSVHFELYSFYNNFITFNHPESSLTCPADSTQVMTVGATYWQNDNLESFSSRGPTNNNHVKPDVTAPDYVSTYTYGEQNFPGTSASTPHTAGAAALLKGVNSSLTATQLQTVLESTALDLGAGGKDNSYGSGRINVWNAFNSATVNVPPHANDDYYSTEKNTVLSVAAPGVKANDSDGDNDTITASKITNPSHGSLTFNNGAFTYTPTFNYYGTDSFTYRNYDGTVYSNTATVHINITNVNHNPNANNDTKTVTEDSNNNQINVKANDNDPDGDPLTIISVSQPSHGLTTTNGNYAYYTPEANYYGQDTFNYTISDGLGLTDNATVTVTINSVNDPPVACDDVITINEDSPDTQISVLENDVDIENDTLTISSISSASHGITHKDSTHAYYAPAGNYHGPDSFTYTISDGHGGTSTAHVNLTVLPVNDPPNANNDTKTVQEDSVDNSINARNNDNDIDGDPLAIVDVTEPSYGQASTNGTLLSYTPDPNYFGLDNFIYTLSDGQGGFDYATVFVTINNVNDAPIALDDNFTINEDSLSQFDVRSNDIDYDGDALTIISITQPLHGISIYNSNAVTYSPSANYFGNDSFYYTISDGHGGTDTAIIHISVISVNDPPIAVNDATTIPEDSVDIQITVLSNDQDIEGDSLTVFSVNEPLHGQASTNGTFVFYTPQPNYYGTDTITYTVDDGNGGFASALITITVTEVNDPPIANNDYYQIHENSVNNLLDVKQNDTDIDGDQIYINSVTQPIHGTTSINGSYICYTPNTDYTGLDTFTYTITDEHGETNDAMVSISVNSNLVPQAIDDFFSIDEDQNSSLAVLGNDNDPENDDIYIDSITQALHGIAAKDGDRINYSPFANYNGNDTFSYMICDGFGGYASANVTITVLSVNDPPVAQNDYISLTEDSINTSINVLDNDSDIENDSLSIQSVTAPGHGVSGFYLNTALYTPSSNYYGLDSFVYTISDNNGGTDTATIYINVTPVNDPPIARNDSYTVIQGTLNQLRILTNDSDVDADLLVISNVSTPFHGNATIVTNYVNYISISNYTGIDTFTYNITDNHGEFASATVTLNVIVYSGGGGGGDSGGGGDTEGTLENAPPVANLSFGEPYVGFVNQPVRFDGSRSKDTDGNITKYQWNFGDNTTGTGMIINHQFTKVGRYNVTLTVKDDKNTSSTDWTICVIKQPNYPPSTPVLTGPQTGRKNFSYNFSVMASDSDNDTIRHHFIWGDGTNTTTLFALNHSLVNVNHSWSSDNIYWVSVRAEDENGGLSPETTITVLIDVDIHYLDGMLQGYLIDYGKTGFFTKFHDNATGETINITRQQNGLYILDIDGDGVPDYTYSGAQGLAVYRAPKKGTPGFELASVIIGCLILVILSERRKTKS